ncbi:MAG: AMP-binding protein [Alphaproteobacteria bacterium]|nr:AMP-binding protein [Alphaproteobacteria bacterium]
MTPPFDTLGAALAGAARADGAAEALIFPHQDRRLSFQAWHATSAALARALAARGFAPGTRVTLLAENRIEWPIVQFAAALAGLVLVPLNTHCRTEDLADVLGRSRARALFLSPVFRSNRYLEMARAVAGATPDLELVVPFDGEPAFERLINEGARSAALLPTVAAADVAGLLYTSGTTGRPKGALLSHAAMLADSWASATRLGVRAGDRWTSIVPLFHCAGCIMNMVGCVQARAAYVGVPAFDAETMCRVIAAERCTILTGVPTSYLAMLNHPGRGRHDMTSLRLGTCGGADADAAILAACARDFPCPGLVQVYGMTETSTLVAAAAPDDPERHTTAGEPLDGVAVRITDPTSRAVLPMGAVGQVEARGTPIMVGYDDDPAATAEVLGPDGWLQTGDLGRLTPTGRLQLAGGRLRDMIIRGGENIYPVEIERVLLRHPAVEDVAVFAIKDAYYGEAVAGAFHLRGVVRATELQAFCAQRIARFKVPAQLYRVDTFPLTASGKVRKVQLRAMAEAGELPALP